MKRKILVTILVFILSFTTAFYLLRYKQGFNYVNKIPSNTKAVVSIDLRKLEHHVVFDFIKNPRSYLKSKKKKDSIDNKLSSPISYIKLPKRLLIHSADTNLTQWISNKFRIKKKAKFIASLKKENFKIKDSSTLITLQKKEIFVTIKNEECIFHYNTKGENPFKENTTYLEKGSPLFDYLTLHKNKEITYTDYTNSNFQMQFNNGVCLINGIANTSKLKIGDFPNTENSFFNLQTSFNQIELNNYKKKYQKELLKLSNNLHVSLDSVMTKWNGKMNLTVFGYSKQKDTIVSYTYDDDFNKVAAKKVVENTKAEYQLNLGNNNQTIFNYFNANNNIKTIDSQPVFTLFPLQKTMISINTHNELVFNSANIKKHVSNTSFDQHFLNIEINPILIEKEEDKAKILKVIKHLLINIDAHRNLTGKIEFNNANRNSFGQLVSNLK